MLSDEAAAEPELLSVRLGMSPEESAKAGAAVVGSMMASKAPVPRHWLAVPQETVSGTTSWMEVGRKEWGEPMVARSKRCVVSSDELRLIVIVPGMAMREPSGETA